MKIFAVLCAVNLCFGCVSNDDILIDEPEIDPPGTAAVVPVEAKEVMPPTEGGGKAVPQKMLPPVDLHTQGAVIPLPKDSQSITVQAFVREWRPAFLKYAPLAEEYHTYFLALNAGDDEGLSVEALKSRLRENFERSHWSFVQGVHEVLESLSSESSGVLIADKEEYFISNMKVLVFIAKELSEISSDQKYLDFTRGFYTRVSERYFGRVLKPLQKEP